MRIFFRVIFGFVMLLYANIAIADNQIFQNMDNQVGVGLSYSNASVYNPHNSMTQLSTGSTAANVAVEDLFDNNIWLGVSGDFAFKTFGGNNGYSQLIQQFNFPADLLVKGGYSFNWPNLGIQLIPYLNAGYALNYNGEAIMQNGFAGSYYNVLGGGARIEYVFLPNMSIYFDQNISYLDDASGDGNYNQSAMSYTSMLGLRYNPMSTLQFSLVGMFNSVNTTNSQLGFDNFNLSYQNTNQALWGGMLMVSYLFDNQVDNKVSDSSAVSDNQQFANFDNNFSLGFGTAIAKNKYTNGQLPEISSNLDFYDLNITHLFTNGVWTNIEGKLINNLNQTNTVSGDASRLTPTYLGFPGAATLNMGYAFNFLHNLQVIPYGNFGLQSNINSYTIKNTNNLTSAVSQDKYYQYGLGGRLEYNVNTTLQVYFDQLFAFMDDQSGEQLDTYNSNSVIGALFNVYDNLQLGVSGFYAALLPHGTMANNGVDYALNQSTLGLEVSLGFRY